MNKRIRLIIDYLIVFIGTSVLPNLITYITSIDINIAVLSSIVAITLYTFLKMLNYIIDLKQENTKLKDNQLKNKNFNTFYLYSISSRAWASIVETNNIHIINCTILVRGTIIEEANKDYEDQLLESLNVWKRLRSKGKITNLKIVKTDHIPDEYFCIMDNKTIFRGLNNFDSDDCTGQNGDRDWNIINEKKQVDKYLLHFENYLNKYQNKPNHVLFDSTKE